MTLIIETHIKCDKCGATFGLDDKNHKGMQQRVRAAKIGWVANSNRDICPNCKPRNNIRQHACGLRFMHNRCISRTEKSDHILISEHLYTFWPGNKLNGEIIYRFTRINKNKDGTTQRPRHLYAVTQKGRRFNSIQKFVEHYGD